MAKIVRIRGVQATIQAMKKAKVGQGKKLERGLKRAGLFLQRKSQQVVPVDTGNLKGSAFTRATGKGFNTKVFVGYTAGYAIYVHENLNARHKPGKQAKYLEGPAKEHKNEILKIIEAELKKKK